MIAVCMLSCCCVRGWVCMCFVFGGLDVMFWVELV